MSWPLSTKSAAELEAKATAVMVAMPSRRWRALPIRNPRWAPCSRTRLLLMKTIDSTNVHYIRCIKPNELKRHGNLIPWWCWSQLRACGVLETIRISCAGFPSRWSYVEFADRYHILSHQTMWLSALGENKTERVESDVVHTQQSNIGINHWWQVQIPAVTLRFFQGWYVGPFLRSWEVTSFSGLSRDDSKEDCHYLVKRVSQVIRDFTYLCSHH